MSSLVHRKTDYDLVREIPQLIESGIRNAACRIEGQPAERKQRFLSGFMLAFNTASDDFVNMDVEDRRGNFSLLAPAAAAYCAVARDLKMPVDLKSLFLDKLDMWIDAIATDGERAHLAFIKTDLSNGLLAIITPLFYQPPAVPERQMAAQQGMMLQHA